MGTAHAMLAERRQTLRVASQVGALPHGKGVPAGESGWGAKGELDLAIFVMDEDAPFLVNAIRDRGLQIAGFSHLDVVSRRLPHFRTGRIGSNKQRNASE